VQGEVRDGFLYRTLNVPTIVLVLELELDLASKAARTLCELKLPELASARSGKRYD
jgi:hypothetical protein